MSALVPSQAAAHVAANRPAIVFGLVLVAGWEAITRSLALPQQIIPAPSFIIWSLYVRADLLIAHARTVLAFLIAFFPMVINTVAGTRGLGPDMANYATSLACSRWQMFAKVELPASLTSIFAGMKIACNVGRWPVRCHCGS
jgi:ABC-type nitrate/sulfonate/bicarbonate transport system permease component